MSASTTTLPNRWRASGWWFARFVLSLVVFITYSDLQNWWMQTSHIIAGDRTKGWRMTPRGVLQIRHEQGPFHIKLNSRGFRGSEFLASREPGRFRIASIGGSLSFGHGIPVDRTYAKVLERRLGTIEVINLACVGYSLDQQYILLKEQLPELLPDLVLQCVNDPSARWILSGLAPDADFPKCRVDQFGPNGLLTIQPPSFMWWQRFVGYSSSFGPFQVPMAKPLWNDLEDSGEMGRRLDAFEALIMATRDVARQVKAEYLAIYIPQYLPDSGEVRRRLHLLADTGAIHLVDATETLEAATKIEGGPNPFVSSDDRHLTEYGHFLIAHLLLDHLPEKIRSHAGCELRGKPTMSAQVIQGFALN